jgi:hypothetical protein
VWVASQDGGKVYFPCVYIYTLKHQSFIVSHYFQSLFPFDMLQHQDAVLGNGSYIGLGHLMVLKFEFKLLARSGV